MVLNKIIYERYMPSESIEILIQRLSNLKQYEKCTREELITIAETKEAHDRDFVDELDVTGMFTDKDEQKLARGFLKKYLDDYELETISDKNILKQLIYLEVFNITRLQKSAEDFQTKNKAVPLQILDSIHKNIDKIIQLKDKLGLTKDSKGVQNDAYKTLETIFRKAKIWRENNQASRTKTCPYCSRLIMWKIRPEAWELEKHPFFKDRILGNPHLVKLYQEGKITKEDAAKILGVSSDYIDWLIKRWEGNNSDTKN